MSIARRVYRRHAISLRVYIRTDADWVEGSTADVSRRGLLVRIGRTFEVGVGIEMRVEMTDGRMLALLGIVRRVQEAGPEAGAMPGLGIELVGMSDEVQQRWDTFVLGVDAEEPLAPAPGDNRLYHGERTEVLEQQMLRDQIAHARQQAEARAVGAPVARPGRHTAARFGGNRQGVAQLVVLPKTEAEVRSLARHVYDRVRIYLQTRSPRTVGEQVSVILVHPDTDAEFSLDGRVASVVRAEDGEQIGLRVRFEPLPPELALPFESFVETGEPLALGGERSAVDRAALLRGACQRTPDRARPFAELGLLLLVELGDVDGARVALQRAFDLDPEREDVAWALATVCALEHDRASAVRFARAARERGQKHQRPESRPDD